MNKLLHKAPLQKKTLKKTFSHANQWSALRRYRSSDSLLSAKGAMRGWGANPPTVPVFSPWISPGIY